MSPELSRNVYDFDDPDAISGIAEGEHAIKDATNSWLVSELVNQTRAGERDDSPQGEQMTALWWVWQIGASIRERLAHH